ncbi:hypothetical protein LB506_002460 [Fusarium annulatum]|nr:hypothetical protein LB506_002460 [Fusarium annulatum]
MSAKETLFSFKVDRIGFSQDIVLGSTEPPLACDCAEALPGLDSKGQHQPEVSMLHDANSFPSSPPPLSSAGQKLQGRMQSEKPTASRKWGLTGAATASLANTQRYSTIPIISSLLSICTYNLMNLLSSDDTGCSMPMGNA